MAIRKDLEIRINNNTAVLNVPLFIYELDHGIELYFKLFDYKYKYDKDPDNILNSNDDDILEAYTTIVNPTGYELTQINGELVNDTVKFVIDSKYTDELDEIGTYTLQIHIKCTHSEFTIPPVQFDVLERLKGKKTQTDDGEVDDENNENSGSGSGSESESESESGVNSCVDVSQFGAKGDGITDDTSAIQQALDYANENNMYVFIPKTDNSYIIKTDLNIPAYVRIDSNGATINPTQLIKLNGNNTIEHLMIDGNWNTHGLQVAGDNCTIRYNQFKNIKNNSTGNYGLSIGIDIKDNVYHTTISHNIFDGLACYIEGNSNDNYRTARFIRVMYSPFTSIFSNVFKGSTTITDTDYVHYQSMNFRINDTTFPFTSTTFKYVKLDGCVLKDNVFMQNYCKSCVKIQASNIKVENNKFVVDESLNANDYSNIIRALGSDGLTIINNQLINSSGELGVMILVSDSKDVKIINNDIIDTRTTAKDPKCLLIQCSAVLGSEIINNKLECNFISNSKIIHFSATKHAVINNNDILIHTNDATSYVYQQLLYFIQGSSGETTECITFANNTVKKDILNLNDKVIILGYNQTNDIKIVNNIMEVETAFEFAGITNLDVLQNVMKMSNGYPITFKAGAGVYDKINIANNVFDFIDASNNFIIIRSFGVITSVTFSSNNVINFTDIFQPIYDTGGGKVKSFHYIPGLYKATNYDYGYTSKRPTCSLQIGHEYFDRNLNIMLTWTGSKWVKSDGSAADNPTT